MAENLSISEVARRVGMLPTTLRYYESIDLLPPPVRQNGRRRYDASIFQRLEMIHTAQQAGFTLAEIRVLLNEILWSDSPAPKWNALMQRKLQEVSDRLANIQSMKNLLEDILHCDDSQLAECMYQTGQKYRRLR